MKKYKDSYNNCKNEENPDVDKIKRYLNKFKETLEIFIDSFEKNFEDNETLLLKFYLYVKELFLSYINYLNLGLDRSEKEEVFNKIKKNLKIFICKNYGYLNKLLDILSVLNRGNTRRLFLELIIFIIEELNENALNKLKYFDKNKYTKNIYISLMLFEKSYQYYERYLSPNENLLQNNQLNTINEQKRISLDYIKDLNSGAIFFHKDINKIFNSDKYIYNYIYNDLINKYIMIFQKKNNDDDDNLNPYERNRNIVNKLYNILANIQIANTETEKEALCIASILKINSTMV